MFYIEAYIFACYTVRLADNIDWEALKIDDVLILELGCKLPSLSYQQASCD